MQAALDLLSSPVCNAALQQAVVALSVKSPVPSLNQVCCCLHVNIEPPYNHPARNFGEALGRKRVHSQAGAEHLLWSAWVVRVS